MEQSNGSGGTDVKDLTIRCSYPAPSDAAATKRRAVREARKLKWGPGLSPHGCRAMAMCDRRLGSLELKEISVKLVTVAPDGRCGIQLCDCRSGT